MQRFRIGERRVDIGIGNGKADAGGALLGLCFGNMNVHHSLA